MVETMIVSVMVLVSGGMFGLGLAVARHFQFKQVKQNRLEAYVAR